MTEDIQEAEVLNTSNGLQIYQQDKALIDIQISTAKQYPRNLKLCIENAITMVTMDEEIAKSCLYSLNKGGKNITGASVYLAKIIAQNWGNMRLENRVVGFNETHVTCEATCFDLENNLAIRTQIKKPITGSRGRFTEDMCSIVANAGNSIVLRNAIFSVIPASAVKKVYEAAKNKIIGKVTDEASLITRRTAIIKGLKDNYPDSNLTDIEIASSVGKSSISDLSKDDLITLIGFINSIKEGEQTVDIIFRPQINNSRPKAPEDKSGERILILLKDAKNRAGLEKLKKDCITPESLLLYDEMFGKLK